MGWDQGFSETNSRLSEICIVFIGLKPQGVNNLDTLKFLTNSLFKQFKINLVKAKEYWNEDEDFEGDRKKSARNILDLLLNNPEMVIIEYNSLQIRLNFRNEMINEMHRVFSIKDVNINKKLPGNLITWSVENDGIVLRDNRTNNFLCYFPKK